MSKALDVVSQFARRSSVGLMLSGALGNGFSSAANAVPDAGNGTFRAAVCAPATSQFIQLMGKQSALGFGGTSAAAQLVQVGSGTAGVNLKFNYTASDSSTNNDFRQITINFNPGGDNARRATTIRYCFQTEHGSGKLLTYETTFKALSPSKIGNGFQQVSQNSMQFGGLNVRNFVLRKVTISLTDAGASNNNTIGNVSLSIGAGGTVTPVGINLNLGGCHSLFSCPDDDDQQ